MVLLPHGVSGGGSASVLGGIQPSRDGFPMVLFKFDGFGHQGPVPLEAGARQSGSARAF